MAHAHEPRVRSILRGSRDPNSDPPNNPRLAGVRLSVIESATLLESPDGNHPSCRQCTLCNSCNSPFILDGVWFDENAKPVEGLPPPSDDLIAIVVDQPDHDTDDTGDPTLSNAVAAVRDLLQLNHPGMLKRVWITHAIGCRAKASLNKKGKVQAATDKQVQACQAFLHQRFASIKPKAIITLGATAVQAVTGKKDVLQMTGRQYSVRVTTVSDAPTKVVNVKRAKYDIYCGRDCELDGVKLTDIGWGNPFKITDACDRDQAIAQYREWMPKQPELVARLPELKGRTLGCHCKPKSCHVDFLKEEADKLTSAIIEIPVYPLWAINYANNTERQYQRYLELWKATLTTIAGESLGKKKAWESVNYVVARSLDEFDAWWDPVLDNLDQPIGWDTEATGLKPWIKDFRVFLMSFSHPSQPATLIVPIHYKWEPDAFKGEYPDLMQRLRTILESRKIKKIGHNLKFDCNAIAASSMNHDWSGKNTKPWRLNGFLSDTQILEYCIDPNTLGYRGLDDVIRKYLHSWSGYWKPLEEWKAAHPEQNYEEFPPEILIPYAACDTAAVIPVFNHLVRLLDQMGEAGHGGWFVRAGLDHPVTPTYSVSEYALFARRVHHLMACEIERNGLAVDVSLVSEMQSYYGTVRADVQEKLENDPTIREYEQNHLIADMAETTRKDWLRKTAFEIIPDLKPRTPLKKFKDQVLASDRRPHINWGSPPQLVKFFSGYLKLPTIKKTEGGGVSVDADVLGTWGLVHGCRPAELLLDYREADKFLTSYVDPLASNDPEDRLLMDDGLVHADFKVTGPVTGRLATSRPNVQCVDADTLVSTDCGPIPIRRLQVGDLVLTHKSRYKRCLNVFIKDYAEQFLVTTESGRQIVCTAHHRFFVADASSPEGGRWEHLCNIGVGDQVITVRDFHVAVERSGQTRQADGSVVPRFQAVISSRADDLGTVQTDGGASVCATEFRVVLRVDGCGREEASVSSQPISHDWQPQRDKQYSLPPCERSAGRRRSCEGENVGVGDTSVHTGATFVERSSRDIAQGRFQSILPDREVVVHEIQSGGGQLARGVKLGSLLQTEQRGSKGAASHQHVSGGGRQHIRSKKAEGIVGLWETADTDRPWRDRRSDCAADEQFSVASTPEPPPLRDSSRVWETQICGTRDHSTIGTAKPRDCACIPGERVEPGGVRRQSICGPLTSAGITQPVNTSEADPAPARSTHKLLLERCRGDLGTGIIETEHKAPSTTSDRQHVRGLLPTSSQHSSGSGRHAARHGWSSGSGRNAGREADQHGVQGGADQCQTREGGRPVETVAPVGERIVSIKSVGVREVWDCTIEDDHSYVANGMISHNSLPRDGLVKRLYISRFKKGWILQRDYSGLEVRILALFSREPALLEAFRNGKDPHLRTQEYFFKEQADKSNKTQRSVCKRCLFGRIYGQGDDGLMELLRKERVPSPTTGEPITKEECHEFNQQIDELYPQVPTWVRLAHRQAIKFHWTCSAFGFTVPLQPMVNHAKVYGTPGNPRRYSDLTKQEEEIRGQVAAALRHAQNYGIQGTASDITSFAAWQIRQRFRKAKLKALLILVVHDAIYVDCPDEEVLEASMIMHDVMDNVPKWIGTMLPDYDPSWIDIPIIGEQETGINAKDALAAIKEPTEIGESFSDMILKVPKYDEDDARCDQVTRVFGHAKEITFLDNKALIRDYLASQRLVFR